jgi:hypothetical protein
VKSLEFRVLIVACQKHRACAICDCDSCAPLSRVQHPLLEAVEAVDWGAAAAAGGAPDPT